MLTVKNSILRSLLVIIVSLVFVWIAWTVLIPGDEGNKFIAWGCFCFFFATFFKGVYHLADRRVKILIDANGIYFPGQQRSIIDWSAIKEFEIERNQYQDVIWIELKRGEPLYLKMFYLNIRPEELHRHVESCMMRAAGNESYEDDAGSDESENSDAGNAETEPEMVAEDFEAELNKSLDSEELEDSEDSDELEEAGDPDASILTQAWHLPAWFSDEPVTNDIIWTGVLTGGIVAMLFGLTYLAGDPPKISLAEQIMVVIAFGVLAPFFLFMFSFFRGTSTHREWAGLDSKKSVSYSVKAAADKLQKTGESPRQARNKKHSD
jgi:hypothetical protein